MAVDYSGTDITVEAGESLAAMQYRFVKIHTDGKAMMMDAATDIPTGILQNDPASGEAAVIRIDGTSKCVANAAIEENILCKAEYVGAADNGKLDAADTANDLARALTLQGSGAEDDVVGVLLLFARIHA